MQTEIPSECLKDRRALVRELRHTHQNMDVRVRRRITN